MQYSWKSESLLNSKLEEIAECLSQESALDRIETRKEKVRAKIRKELKSEDSNRQTKDWLCSEQSGEDAPRCSDKLLLADDSMSDLLRLSMVRKSELESPACVSLGSLVREGGAPKRKRAFSYHSSPERSRWLSQGGDLGGEPRSSSLVRRDFCSDDVKLNLSSNDPRERKIVISMVDKSETAQTCEVEGKK